jgi:hypothetical protein
MCETREAVIGKVTAWGTTSLHFVYVTEAETTKQDWTKSRFRSILSVCSRKRHPNPVVTRRGRVVSLYEGSYGCSLQRRAHELVLYRAVFKPVTTVCTMLKLMRRYSTFFLIYWEHLSIYLSIYLVLYRRLLDLGHFFSFLILYTIGRIAWTADQPVARPLPTHRTT